MVNVWFHLNRTTVKEKIMEIWKSGWQVNKQIIKTFVNSFVFLFIYELKFIRYKMLNRIYICFLTCLSTILESPSIIWNTCTQYEDNLDKTSKWTYIAVTTNSPRLCKVCRGIGWLTLTEKQKHWKLVLILKIKND